MKSLFLSLAAVAMLVAAPVLAQEQAIGEKAPMITAPLMGIDGKANTLLDLKEANYKIKDIQSSPNPPKSPENDPPGAP